MRQPGHENTSKREQRLMVRVFGPWVNEANGLVQNFDDQMIDLIKASTGDLAVAVGEEQHRRPLGFAGAAKQPAFQAIEAMGGSKKPKSSRFPHHDSCCLRTDFDNVGV
jgi:hypothetical protein